MKIEHLGIAIKSLETSDNLFARLLGKSNYKQESLEREGVTTSCTSSLAPSRPATSLNVT